MPQQSGTLPVLFMIEMLLLVFLTPSAQKVGTSWPMPGALLLASRMVSKLVTIGTRCMYLEAQGWHMKQGNKASKSFHLALSDSDYTFIFFPTVSMLASSPNNTFEFSSCSLRSHLASTPFTLYHASHKAPVAHRTPCTERNSFAEFQICGLRAKML